MVLYMVESQKEHEFRLPCPKALEHASKIACADDKPIMLDYWTASQSGSVLIGVREGGEKLLVKSEDEYTSPVAKIFKVEDDYLVVTENSIYITSASIQSRKIS